MKDNEDYTVCDVTAQEIAMHTSLVVCADYVRSWGFTDFIYRLADYSDDEELNQFASLLEKYDEQHNNDSAPDGVEEQNS